MGNTIPTTVRIPEELKSNLEEIAKRENRSLNNLSNTILQSYVNEDFNAFSSKLFDWWSVSHSKRE